MSAIGPGRKPRPSRATRAAPTATWQGHVWTASLPMSNRPTSRMGGARRAQTRPWTRPAQRLAVAPLGGGALQPAARPPPRRRPCRSGSPGRGGQSRRVLTEGGHATSEMEMCEMCARQRGKRAAAGLVVARGGSPAQARLPCGAGLRRLAASHQQAGKDVARTSLGTCP